MQRSYSLRAILFPAAVIGSILLAVPRLPARAQDAAPAQAAATSSAEQELTTLLQQFAAASIRGDAGFFDRVLADDYTFITTKGEYKNKAQALQDYRGHAIKFRSHVFDEIAVHVYGDTAVVTNRAVSVSTFKGKARNGVTRNTRVFVRRDGRWQCVSFQSTEVRGAK